MKLVRLLSVAIVVSALLAGCGGGHKGVTIPINPPDDSENQPPTITSLSPSGTANSPVSISTSGNQHMAVVAVDPDGDTLTFTWTVDKGQIIGSKETADYTAPANPCVSVVTVTVSDGHNHTAQARCYYQVATSEEPEGNDPPMITSVTADPSSVPTGASSTVTAVATDPDGDQLTYTWQTAGGAIQSSEGNQAVWTAPAAAGSYTVTVYVSDGHNVAVSKSVAIGVETTPDPPVTNGLNATYIQNEHVQARPDLTKGTVVFTRIDAAINFDWGRKAPDPLLITLPDKENGHDFGVIWKGYIKCEQAGTYAFAAEYDDGFRMQVSDDSGNMHVVINAWDLGPRDKEQGSLTVSGGKWYKMEAQYFEDEDRSYVRLWWKTPGATEWTVVPTDAFRCDAP